MSHYQKNYATNTKDFWENCDETFAHLAVNKWLKNYQQLTCYWSDRFVSRMNFDGKTVVDYGTYGITQYTGVDISERSIAKARINLEEFRDEVSFLLSGSNWSSTIADIFVSQACIQHFPSVEYFEAFLDKLNSSAFSELMLQIRYSPNTFSVPDRPVLALFTNFVYIQQKLSSFELEYTSPIENNGYQFGILKRQGAVNNKKIEEIPAGFYEINYFQANSRVDNLERKLAIFQPILRASDALKKAYRKLTS